ncbi:PREDICTED: uncharacterized protein LOC105568212 [Vollenhovia emeryi]|uniref:uncharacterized protein LOC105568212 n=1 Tax=Vollenhovia emeryi TaxID=411798 RepID=UPI0005F46853|nr:PREDICTED: uncharacterized protein LOC105568212 [Vollenhovia emeryi]
MPSYKLIYYPITALAEPIRFLFNYAGIEFEDERFDRKDWPKLKPTMPFGKVPVLIVDGKKIDQSVAIGRYLAKQCGLAGKNDWESLEIDSTIDTIHDLRLNIAGFHYESNEQAKETKRKIAKETTVPYYLERLDAQVKKNGGYFVGGALSWADFTFVALLEYLNFMMNEDIVEKYKNLKQLQKKVEEVPAIKKWIAKRPATILPVAILLLSITIIQPKVAQIMSVQRHTLFTDPSPPSNCLRSYVPTKRSVVLDSRTAPHRLSEPRFLRQINSIDCKNMPTYKLTYFNVTGLGESLRFLLNHCGIKFEDVRINFDDWPKYKPNMPMGQMPVLEIDGKQYNQSRAIGRFLAKKADLYGSDDFEAMEIDATVDSIDDIRQALSSYYWEQDSAFKEKLKKTAFEKLPFYLDKFEAQVKKNGGYFVGGKLSWPDFLWAGYCDYLGFVLAGDPNKDHPELKKLVEKVRALPKVKAYIEKRPKTQL